MSAPWQQRSEDWIGSMTLGDVADFYKEPIGCACVGPRLGEPLCGCRMARHYIDRTKQFVMLPIVRALKERGTGTVINATDKDANS